MSDEIMLVFGEDGVAREYDDTWDITIHCDSEEEQKAVWEKLNNSTNESSLAQKGLDKDNGNLQPTCNQLATVAKDINVLNNDTISRQAAVDAIAQCTICGDEDTLRAYVLKHNLDNGWTGGVLEALDAVKDLPSAQPDIDKDINVPCKDTISKQAAIDAVRASASKYTGFMEMENYTDDDAVEAIEGVPSAQPEPQWIPVSERLPEEAHWLGGSGKQFSDMVLISITNREDEDAWSDISQTIDGEWGLELPRHCKITAWMPLPEPYREGGGE